MHLLLPVPINLNSFLKISSCFIYIIQFRIHLPSYRNLFRTFTLSLIRSFLHILELLIHIRGKFHTRLWIFLLRIFITR